MKLSVDELLPQKGLSQKFFYTLLFIRAWHGDSWRGKDGVAENRSSWIALVLGIRGNDPPWKYLVT